MSHIMELHVLIGIAGMAFILTAFLLNLFKMLLQDTSAYCTMNAVGGLLLGYNAYVTNSLPFLILEIVWTISSLFRLYRINRR